MGPESMNDNNIKAVTKFEGRNFPDWKFQVVNLLKSQGLWSIVNGKETSTEKESKDQPDNTGSHLWLLFYIKLYTYFFIFRGYYCSAIPLS